MASTVLPHGTIVPEKFSRDWYADLYHNWQELDNLLGGGTPKDGTLTIQKNGDTVGTFSANQSTDETVNIEVPTATSELTNDSGYITGVAWDDVSDKPSFATVATSGSYNDLSNKPTIPTVNNATLTIQKNGTTIDTFTANSSSDKTVNIQCVDLSNNQTVGGNKEFTGTTTAHDLVPSATDRYNLGTSANKWKSFNGINPGALSLPNVYDSGVVAVDTTNFTWNTNWIYTPLFNGWVTVWVQASSATGRRFAVSHGYLRYWYSIPNGEIFRFSFPVIKNVSVYFAFTSDIEETVAPTIYLLKAHGNV